MFDNKKLKQLRNTLSKANIKASQDVFGKLMGIERSSYAKKEKGVYNFSANEIGNLIDGLVGILDEKQLTNVLVYLFGAEKNLSIAEQGSTAKIGFSCVAGAEIEKSTESETISSKSIEIITPADSGGDLLNMAREILDSDSHWRDALSLNIESLYKGLVTDREDRRKSEEPDKIPETGDRRRAVG